MQIIALILVIVASVSFNVFCQYYDERKIEKKRLQFANDELNHYVTSAILPTTKTFGKLNVGYVILYIDEFPFRDDVKTIYDDGHKVDILDYIKNNLKYLTVTKVQLRSDGEAEKVWGTTYGGKETDFWVGGYVDKSITHEWQPYNFHYIYTASPSFSLLMEYFQKIEQDGKKAIAKHSRN